MTQWLPSVVSSHERFLEYQDKRRRLAFVAHALAAAPAPEADPGDAADMTPFVPTPGVESKT